ncbi:uncharacterized protein [Excalfactoria chinensis]|uniref:uncharacterized protein n=1 Tax=Excalfactoria chinensis TaxID=46218 RepID=UPI003B3B1E7A
MPRAGSRRDVSWLGGACPLCLPRAQRSRRRLSPPHYRPPLARRLAHRPVRAPARPHSRPPSRGARALLRPSPPRTQRMAARPLPSLLFPSLPLPCRPRGAGWERGRGQVRWRCGRPRPLGAALGGSDGVRRVRPREQSSVGARCIFLFSSTLTKPPSRPLSGGLGSPHAARRGAQRARCSPAGPSGRCGEGAVCKERSDINVRRTRYSVGRVLVLRRKIISLRFLERAVYSSCASASSSGFTAKVSYISALHPKLCRVRAPRTQGILFLQSQTLGDVQRSFESPGRIEDDNFGCSGNAHEDQGAE